MQLLRFIEAHPDWKTLLRAEPYRLMIKEEDGFTLLKYDQVFSDFAEPIVKECRGLILGPRCEVVCLPFYKFFNYAEAYADPIDWATARVQQKIDGSILKLWHYEGRWHLSTNGNIDAYKTRLPDHLDHTDTPYSNFGELFEAAENYRDLDYARLDANCTYMFELTSPYNKVVIAYPTTHITHIGTRNNRTGQELEVDIGVDKPRQYPIGTLSDCVKAAHDLPADAEGFVVVDAAWHRVKVKNPIYLQMHRLLGNEAITAKNALTIIRDNEQGEFLSYFPEYKPLFDDIEARLNDLKTRIRQNAELLRQFASRPRKEYAEWVLRIDADNAYYYFTLLHDKSARVEDYLSALGLERLMQKLGIE